MNRRDNKGGTGAAFRSRARATILAFNTILVGVALVASCGGSSLNPSDGQNSAGQENSVNCLDGETRQCVGPGACEGGQVCGASGWEGCDCGAISSAGGAAGRSNANSAAGANTQQGGQGADSPTAGAAGVFGDVENIDWNDDPCSVDGIAVDGTTTDCAGDCPGYHPAPSDIVGGCAPKAKCELTALQILSIDKLDSWLLDPTSFMHRTPRAATIDGPCECQTGTPIFAKYRVHFDFTDTSVVHLKVRPPWHVGTDPSATCASEPQQCVEGSGTWNAVLWTESANAPATNALLKLGPCD